MTTTDIQSPAPGTCPCGSNASPADCCVPYIQGKKKPPTAESLLRARYSAFVRGDIDYIVKTHHSKTSKDVSKEDIEDWSKNSKWMGLRVLESEKGQANDEQGTVNFHAQYRAADGSLQDHWEHSLFEKENGEWRFVDAQALKHMPMRRMEPKTGRNDPCPCGSGKKYKKCCADATA